MIEFDFEIIQKSSNFPFIAMFYQGKKSVEAAGSSIYMIYNVYFEAV